MKTNIIIIAFLLILSSSLGVYAADVISEKEANFIEQNLSESDLEYYKEQREITGAWNTPKSQALLQRCRQILASRGLVYVPEWARPPEFVQWALDLQKKKVNIPKMSELKAVELEVDPSWSLEEEKYHGGKIKSQKYWKEELLDNGQVKKVKAGTWKTFTGHGHLLFVGSWDEHGKPKGPHVTYHDEMGGQGKLQKVDLNDGKTAPILFQKDGYLKHYAFTEGNSSFYWYYGRWGKVIKIAHKQRQENSTAIYLYEAEFHGPGKFKMVSFSVANTNERNHPKDYALAWNSSGALVAARLGKVRFGMSAKPSLNGVGSLRPQIGWIYDGNVFKGFSELGWVAEAGDKEWKCGKWSRWNDHGQTLESGEYKDDLKSGPWKEREYTIVGERSILISTATGSYASGKKHGIWKVDLASNHPDRKAAEEANRKAAGNGPSASINDMNGYIITRQYVNGELKKEVKNF